MLNRGGIMEKAVLGMRIRVKRKEQKLTLEKLAEKADIGLVYLGEIERGVKMPSLNTFIKLVNALDISADELIYDETKSGKEYLSSEMAEKMKDLSPEQYAAVTAIALSTIEQIKKLEKNI